MIPDQPVVERRSTLHWIFWTLAGLIAIWPLAWMIRVGGLRAWAYLMLTLYGSPA